MLTFTRQENIIQAFTYRVIPVANMGCGASTALPEHPAHGGAIRKRTPHRSASLGAGASTSVTELRAQARPPIYPIRSTRMGAGASTLLSELVDKQQAKAAAGDRFDEAAFDAAAVDGRVPREVFTSWLQALRDGATTLDLSGPTLLGGRVGAGTAGQPHTRNHADMRALGASAASSPLPRSRGPLKL